jgi:hypothetical protein
MLCKVRLGWDWFDHVMPGSDFLGQVRPVKCMLYNVITD